MVVWDYIYKVFISMMSLKMYIMFISHIYMHMLCCNPFFSKEKRCRKVASGAKGEGSVCHFEMLPL